VGIDLVLQGAILGLSLSFMIGPLLFSVVQAGIARGFRAGLAVAAGIWVCDVFYVLAIRYGIVQLNALVNLPHFRFWSGICGGLLLLIFGISGLFSANNPVGEIEKAGTTSLPDLAERNTTRPHWKELGLPAYWVRGFLLNLINPGTIFFWIGIATAVVIPNNWDGRQISLFFGGMLGALVITDTLKAYAAKRVRHWLTPTHTRLIQRGIGLLLMVFGLALVIRVL
jgi:threonine/homoserine/homoserine lactone efflux protein